MCKSGCIAIIVEGENRELGYFRNISSLFFPPEKVLLVCLPAGENIYMLWKKLNADDFETDIIEVLRECSKAAKDELKNYTRQDFQEVYLFFDLDSHQNNLKEGEDPDAILRKMLETFDNETENGKLYISYPMCEALRDIQEGTCQSSYKCSLDTVDILKYKKHSATYSKFVSVNKFTVETWKMIIAIFLLRCQCLFFVDATDQAYHWYKQHVTTMYIFEKEQMLIHSFQQVFVLSAFPEFLVDYFREDFWQNLNDVLSSVSRPNCSKIGLADKGSDVSCICD